MLAAKRDARWSTAWPDAVAFAAGLAIAWWLRWRTTDLVWSLWLSSLVVGYASIVWTIARPVLTVGRGLAGATLGGEFPMPAAARGALVVPVMLLGGAAMLAFFTVHFGMFHYVHSQFLNGFFPVLADGGQGMAGAATYAEVVRRYWGFLPAAFLAEREMFVRGSPGAAPAAASPARGGNAFTAPYRNVVRMHLLIFFFAAVHFAKVEHFAVYAVVYAVYFFPWRRLYDRGPRG